MILLVRIVERRMKEREKNLRDLLIKTSQDFSGTALD
jgi:hypothetical protein